MIDVILLLELCSGSGSIKCLWKRPEIRERSGGGVAELPAFGAFHNVKL